MGNKTTSQMNVENSTNRNEFVTENESSFKRHIISNTNIYENNQQEIIEKLKYNSFYENNLHSLSIPQNKFIVDNRKTSATILNENTEKNANLSTTFIISNQTIKGGKSIIENKESTEIIFKKQIDPTVNEIKIPIGNIEIDCSRKASDSIRRSYIAKLIFKKIWHPTFKEKICNTIILFDWDDTLLCTNYLVPCELSTENMTIPEEDLRIAQQLDPFVTALLKMAISKGDTFIITNAEARWVEYSANIFYPEASKLLKKLHIISARDNYAKHFYGDIKKWKVCSFTEVANNYNRYLLTNIICIGDSDLEIEAAQNLRSNFSEAYIKTIKLKEAPEPEELKIQLRLLIRDFEKIVMSFKNQTINVVGQKKDRRK